MTHTTRRDIATRRDTFRGTLFCKVGSNAPHIFGWVWSPIDATSRWQTNDFRLQPGGRDQSIPGSRATQEFGPDLSQRPSAASSQSTSRLASRTARTVVAGCTRVPGIHPGGQRGGEQPAVHVLGGQRAVYGDVCHRGPAVPALQLLRASSLRL